MEILEQLSMNQMILIYLVSLFGTLIYVRRTNKYTGSYIIDILTLIIDVIASCIPLFNTSVLLFIIARYILNKIEFIMIDNRRNV